MATSPNTLETRGHSAANPGLRGHSCGDHYPLAVVAIGPVNAVGYRVENLKTGRVSDVFRTYKEAEIALIGIRIRDLINQ